MPRPASILAFASLALVTLVATDCVTDPFCEEGQLGCSSDRCANGLRDGDETDVDCGGSCAPCESGHACVAPADCATGRCLASSCCEPPCEVWSRRYGGPATERASQAVVLGDGTIVLAGVLEGTLDLGGAPLVSAGAADVFVAAFAPGGELRWSRRFGGSAYEAQPRLALAPNGHLWLAAGFASDPLDTGAGVFEPSGANGDLFVVELDAQGQSIQARAFSSHGFGVAFVDIAATADGGLVLTGALGRLDLGNGTVLSAAFDPAIGTRHDVFVLALDAALEPVWSRRLGDASEDTAYGLALGPQGDVVLLVEAQTSTDFGGPPLAQPGLVVAAYAQHDGSHRWSRSYGGGVRPIALQVDGAGDVFVAGDLTGEADLGTGKLRPKGTTDAFVARLGVDGAPAWVAPVAASVDARTLALLRRAEGGLVAALVVTGDVDLGGGITAPVGVDSLVLVRLDLDGRFEWARGAGGVFLKVPVGLADLPEGRLLAFGGFAGTLELTPPLLSAGSSDVFASELLP